MSICRQGFTKSSLTREDWFKLIGATPRQFCELTQPDQCKLPVNEATKEKCMNAFQQCVADATPFDTWHRIS